MSCGLAGTGVDASVLVVATAAVACLGTGLAILSRRRRRRSRAAAPLLLLLLVLGGAAALASLAPVPAMAAAPCDLSSTPTTTTTSAETTAPVDNSLTVVQTSTMKGLAPSAPAKLITGLVTNNGPDSTFITAVSVEISSVVKAPGAPSGRCDASDYVLLDTRMPVGQTLAPSGGSATFAGALIGFRDKTTNQDACKRATIHLLYTVNPG